MSQLSSVKKSIVSKPAYQQRFVPVFLKAENDIKRTIIEFWWLGKSKNDLLLKIRSIVNKMARDLPKDLIDREIYINGIYMSANKMIKQVYEKAVYEFALAQTELTNLFLTYGARIPNIATPQKLSKLIKAKLNNRTVWAEAKGVPYIKDYQTRVKRLVKDLAEQTSTTYEDNRKHISLIQKAELQTRHDSQMEMVDNLREQEIEYCWISSHVNCSKRCEKWQGKLVALTGHATQSGMRMGKLDGYTVYSLTDIMDQTDKYGYKNNIINGFNCRHKLIPYKRGTVAPTDYNAKAIKRQRQIEANIRQMEREIITLKEERNGLYAIQDFKNGELLNQKINVKIAYYKKYCDVNGYAWTPFRIGQGIM